MHTTRPRLALWVLVATLALSALLSGCAPAATPTLPPATLVQPPEPATAQPPAPPAPTAAEPTAYVMPPTAAGPAVSHNPYPAQGSSTVAAPPTQPATVEPPKAEGPVALDLLVLHTNDVMGEMDPCG